MPMIESYDGWSSESEINWSVILPSLKETTPKKIRPDKFKLVNKSKMGDKVKNMFKQRQDLFQGFDESEPVRAIWMAEDQINI